MQCRKHNVKVPGQGLRAVVMATTLQLLHTFNITSLIIIPYVMYLSKADLKSIPDNEDCLVDGLLC